jgi:hypothetical protein
MYAFFRQLLICVLFTATASATTCEIVLKQYTSRRAQKSKDPKCYSPGSCHLNILNLYKSISQELGYKNDDIRALILFRPSFEEGLLPVRATSTKMYKADSFGWSFHVVLEYQGKIYDFDYHHKKNDIPIVRDYFISMFSSPSPAKASYLERKFDIGSKEIFESFANMEVIDLPASYFLETYGKRIKLGRADMDYFLFGAFSNEVVYSEPAISYMKRKDKELGIEW